VSGNLYRGHRLPREIISYAAWFYYRFAASFRDVEDVRPRAECWSAMKRCDKFGHLYVAGLRARLKRVGPVC
jgi:hypothetical protein